VITRLKDRVKVPLPVDINRSALVESRVMGANLHQVRLDDPEQVLDMILDEVKKAYELDVIHADLSEYNVMIDEEGEITLIDWPQWIPTSHPNADEILKRDLENVVNYFRRKYDVRRETADEFSRVVG
jgi:RIO kinase 2